MTTRLETVSVGARTFDIHVFNGDITLRATEQDGWEFEWSSDRDEPPILERDGDTLRLRQQGEPINPPRLNLRVALPSNAEVVGARTGNGRVMADGVHGTMTLQSDNGDVLLKDASGDLTLKTASGRVDVHDIDGKLHVANGNGDSVIHDATGQATIVADNGRVEVIAPRELALTVQSGHGDIQIGDGSAGPVQAHTKAGTIHCSVDLSEEGHHLSSGHGDVHLRMARGNAEVRTMAGRITVRDSRGQLRVHSGHGDIHVQTAAGSATLETGAGRIEVKIPRELRLHAVSGSGDVHIGEGAVESLTLDTRNGTANCQAKLSSGAHTINSGHGDIHVRAARGECVLSTNAGKVEVQEAAGTLTVRSGNGDVIVRSAGGTLDLHTGRGRIEVEAPRAARIRAHSGHGDVKIGDGSMEALDANTNAGCVRCAADFAPGRFELTSGSGDLSVKLRPDVRARLDAQTNFGQVHADFPLVRVGRAGSMSFNGTRMVGSLGSGEHDVEIALRTGRGQVEIRRKEGDARRYADASIAPTVREPIQEGPADERVLEVLQSLARGEISVQEAEEMLQSA